MKRKNLFISFASALIVLSLLMLPFISACSRPAPTPEPGPAPTPSPTSTSEKPIMKWRMQHAFSSGDVSYQITATQMVNLINEIGAGQLKVELYASGALVAPEEMYSAIHDGAIEAGYDYSGFFMDIEPVVILGGLPGGPQNPYEQYDFLYHTGAFELMQKGYEKRGYHLIVNPFAGQTVLYTSKSVASSWNDIKGRKGFGGPVAGLPLEKLGAINVPVPGYDMYSASKLGTIDFFGWTIAELETMNLKEVTKSVVLDPVLIAPADAIIVSLKEWNKLDAKLQQKLTDELRYRTLDIALRYHDKDLEALKKGAQYGVKLVTFSDANRNSFTKACVQCWDDLAKKDALLAEGIGLAKDWMKRWGRSQ